MTIPKAVRDLMGLRAGIRVDFRRLPDGRVELVAEDAADPGPLARLRGHAGPGLGTEDIMALTRGEG